MMNAIVFPELGFILRLAYLKIEVQSLVPENMDMSVNTACINDSVHKPCVVDTY